MGDSKSIYSIGLAAFLGIAFAIALLISVLIMGYHVPKVHSLV